MQDSRELPFVEMKPQQPDPDCLRSLLLLNSGLDTMHLVFKLMMNDDPLPTSLSTLTDPPICSMIFLQIDSPRPVPDLLRPRFSSKV